MEKQTGPRKRQLTLRVKRDVYYRLADLAKASGLSVEELCGFFLVSLAFGLFKFMIADQVCVEN